MTVTPGSTALVSSVTVPTRLASCANTDAVPSKRVANARSAIGHACVHHLFARVRCPRAVEGQHRFERIAVRRWLQEIFRDRGRRAIRGRANCGGIVTIAQCHAADRIDKIDASRMLATSMSLRSARSASFEWPHADEFTLSYDRWPIADNAVCVSSCKTRPSGRPASTSSRRDRSSSGLPVLRTGGCKSGT